MKTFIRITVILVAFLMAVPTAFTLNPASEKRDFLPNEPVPHSQGNADIEKKTVVTVDTDSTGQVVYDGHVSKFEYFDAEHVRFPNGHGMVDAYIKATDGYLYFLFELPDLTPHFGDDIVIMLDTDMSKSEKPEKTDIRAYIRRKMENSRMHQGDGNGWVNLWGPFEYKASLYDVGWEVEARIPLEHFKLPESGQKKIGLAFRIWDNDPMKIWNWPVGSDENKPDTWGTLVLEVE